MSDPELWRERQVTTSAAQGDTSRATPHPVLASDQFIQLGANLQAALARIEGSPEDARADITNALNQYRGLQRRGGSPDPGSALQNISYYVISGITQLHGALAASTSETQRTNLGQALRHANAAWVNQQELRTRPGLGATPQRDLAREAQVRAARERSGSPTGRERPESTRHPESPGATRPGRFYAPALVPR